MVGGQDVGISEYDAIMRKALSLEHARDDEIRLLLLKELKIFNYIPSSAEQEYLEAMWQAFQRLRDERSTRTEVLRR